MKKIKQTMAVLTAAVLVLSGCSQISQNNAAAETQQSMEIEVSAETSSAEPTEAAEATSADSSAAESSSTESSSGSSAAETSSTEASAGDSYISSFDGDLSSINLNGFTLYIDGEAIS